MASAIAILPGKFEGGDLVSWLREFDACAEANAWKVEDKIKKLPAFLRNQAASHFYAIPSDDRKTYADAVKHLTQAMLPKTNRELYFQQFEGRSLRPGEGPAVFKWELEQLLSKADPDLDETAKTALLTRQFMRGLDKELKIKLLQHDPTPTLAKMVAYVQRHRAIQELKDDNRTHVSATSAHSPEMKDLIAIIKELADKQNHVDAAIASVQSSLKSAPPLPEPPRRPVNPERLCYVCGKAGHLARRCWQNQRQQERRPSPAKRETMQCYECQGYGHIAKDCANHLNFERATR